MKTAKRVYFDGRVQGVGFRATVRWMAEGFEITGWVKNLAEGGIELLAQGQLSEVDDFIQAIRESELAAHIKQVREEKAELDLSQRGFIIM